MKYHSFISALWLLQPSRAWLSKAEPNVWVTVTTDIHTTICPSKTGLFYGNQTYTATVSNLVTITECPMSSSQTNSLTGSVTASVNSSPNVIPTPLPSLISISPVWINTTEIVSHYTTYLSSPTEIVQNSKTYTVTKATTLTVDNCPCTITKTVPGIIISNTISISTISINNPTILTLSGTIYSFSASGSVTIPIVQKTTIPAQNTITSSPATKISTTGSVGSLLSGPSAPTSASEPVTSSGSSLDSSTSKTVSGVEPSLGSGSSASITASSVGSPSSLSSETVAVVGPSSSSDSSIPNTASVIGLPSSGSLLSRTSEAVGPSLGSSGSSSKTLGVAGPSSGTLSSKTVDLASSYPTSSLPLQATGNVAMKNYAKFGGAAVVGIAAALL